MRKDDSLLRGHLPQNCVKFVSSVSKIKIVLPNVIVEKTEWESWTFQSAHVEKFGSIQSHNYTS
eukprot:gene20831-7725_t